MTVGKVKREQQPQTKELPAVNDSPVARVWRSDRIIERVGEIVRPAEGAEAVSGRASSELGCCKRMEGVGSRPWGWRRSSRA